MAHTSYNAAYDKITIFTPDNEPHVCSRLNAKELVASQGFKWKINTSADTPKEAATPEDVAAPTAANEVTATEEIDVVVPVVEDNPQTEGNAPDGVDHTTAPLSEIAKAITGSEDVTAYLRGFTVDALRTMADERYGQKISVRLKDTDKAVESILGWEEEKIESEKDS